MSQSIYGLYGLAHLGLSHFHQMCKHLEVSYAVASPAGLERFELGATRAPFPIVALSAANFLKTYKRFKKPVCMFVVDNPVQLEAIGATILGCTKTRSYHYTFHPVTASDLSLALAGASAPLDVTPTKTQVIYDILRASSVESNLSPLQTLIYRIKSLDDRTIVQDNVYSYLAGCVPETKLRTRFAKLLGQGFVDTVFGVLNHGKFKALRKAATEVTKAKEKGVSWEKIAKEHAVTKFDLKYVCKKAARIQGVVLPG